MNNTLFSDHLAPKINTLTMLTRSPHIWRVSYINVGRRRISLEYVGTIVAEDKMSPVNIRLADGKMLDLAGFHEYAKTIWPQSEQDTKTGETEHKTLAVDNAAMGAKGGL